MLYVTPAGSCSSKFVKDFMFFLAPRKKIEKLETRKISETHHHLPSGKLT